MRERYQIIYIWKILEGMVEKVKLYQEKVTDVVVLVSERY